MLACARGRIVQPNPNRLVTEDEWTLSLIKYLKYQVWVLIFVMSQFMEVNLFSPI